MIDKESLYNTLSQRANYYSFYQLVSVLHKINNIDPEDEIWEKLYQVHFSARTSLGFAQSDVSELKISEQNILMETTFLGLNGSQSPLPNYFLDALAVEDDEGIRKDFLDFFNHRVIALLYRVWRKYRYFEVFKPNAEDKISQQIFSLVGLGIKDLRNESAINWCKMLAYAGMLTGRNRSNQVISGIVGHYFDLKASVDEWVIRTIDIPQDQKSSLGRANYVLGDNFIIGDKIKDCSGKFILNLHSLTFKRFKDFLPSGKEHKTLQEVVSFILRTQMAYDLNLELAPKEAPPLSLHKEHGGYLGWTSFMGDSNGVKKVLIQVRN